MTNIRRNDQVELALNSDEEGEFDVEILKIPFDNTWSYKEIDKRSVVAIEGEKNKNFLHNILYKEK